MKKSDNQAELDQIVRDALKHCSSIEEFSNYTRELLPQVEKYGEELLKCFYNIETTFLYKLKKSRFVVDYKNVHTLMFLPNLYLKSLETSYNKTVQELPYIYSKLDKYNDVMTRHIVNDVEITKKYLSIFKEKNFDISNRKTNVPPYLFPALYLSSFIKKGNASNTIMEGERLYKKMSLGGQYFVYNHCFKSKRPEICPQYIVETNIFLDDRIKGDTKAGGLVKRILNSETYSSEDERAFLEYCNLPYDDVDEWFRAMGEKNPNMSINNARFNSKVLLTLFAKRVANELGIEKCKVNMFSYHPSFFGYATKDGNISFDMRREIVSWKSFVKIIYHELAHLLQYKNMREMNTDMDKDIDVYSKDQLIEEVFGRDYYMMNYSRNSLEIDAQYKAEMLTAKFFGEKEELFKYYCELGKKELDENRGFIEKEEFEIEHFNSRYGMIEVNGKRQKVSRDLNFLCLMALEELTKYKNDKYARILEKIPQEYPIILYDYVLTPTPRRKTVDELIECLKVTDSRAKSIYTYLLEQRLKRDKNSKADVKDSYYRIASVSEETTDEDLKRNLKEILLKDGTIRVNKVNRHV